MRRPTFAPTRNESTFLFHVLTDRNVRNQSLRLISSAFLILALLSQVLLVGPLPRAKAGGKYGIIEPPAPLAMPAQQANLAGTAEPTVIARTLLSLIPYAWENEEPPVGFEAARRPSTLNRITSGITSILGFAAPRTNAKSSSMSAPMPAAVTAVGNVSFDFDGDGKADIGRFHPSDHHFDIKKSSNGTLLTLSQGSASSFPVPGDYDGDHITDVAVFTAGSWSVHKSSDGQNTSASLGTTGDIPVSGDYDGDGVTDTAVYRPSENRWYIQKSTQGSFEQEFGDNGAIPVPGDFDGDGTTDLAYFVPSTGNWFWWKSSENKDAAPVQWGSETDIPLQGDFDGDGKSDLAVYRPTDGSWYVLTSQSDFTVSLNPFIWGTYGDQPVPADYDGDGKTDYAVYRPTTGVWHILKSSEVGEGGGGTINYYSDVYQYQTLGVPGDTAVESVYIKQIGGEVVGDVLAAARLNPKNATGGTNLYSQNFGWATSLFGLPGRAGLDAGFGISYNSLVWLKLGSVMYFDPDHGNAGPGFRFGFPVIEPAYYDSAKSKWVYLMITPDGSRKEFRQVATSNTYESADSTYTQILVGGAPAPDEPEATSITVKTTDGTQMSYVWIAGAFRCSKVMDRNGNFITIANNPQGLMTRVIDTLGRVIDISYDANLMPTTIRQDWRAGNGDGNITQHTWATFSYTTRQLTPNFGGLTTYGPASIRVPDKITFADGSYTSFLYNPFGQMYQAENHAPNSSHDELNHVSINLSAPGAQTDCPRFTLTSSWAKDFGTLTVHNEKTENQNFTAAGHSLTGKTRIQVWTDAHPDNLRTNTFFEPSGWGEGLALATEDCLTTSSSGCDNRQRWSWTAWTQDDPTGTYVVNPRITESQVGDSNNNIKGTTVTYYPNNLFGGGNTTMFGLVQEVDVYEGSSSNIRQKTVTDYDLSTGYVSRRIIGLPTQVQTWGWNTDGTVGSLEPASMVTYGYDENGYGSSQSLTSTQHDGLGYGTGLTYRGNLTSNHRHDVTNPSDTVSSSVVYNTLGLPMTQTNPGNRTVKIDYVDAFNSTGNPATYAYPTTITDAAGALHDPAHSVFMTYRYDTGADFETTSPPPHLQSFGKKTKNTFDSLGRVIKKSLLVNTTEKSYTRYEYPTNGVESKVYNTIVDNSDLGNEGPDAPDEVLTDTWTDGAGRVIGTRTEHPGSVGGWAATKTVYDVLGRAVQQSVPTEVSASSPYDPLNWSPAGDDSSGWLYTYKVYDWKDRVLRIIKPDASDTLVSYEGCGCAGGQVTTMQGEEIIETDWDGSHPQSLGRRTQKMHEDILGRTYKTEVMNWDGTTPYSTTVSHYNGRDQVLRTSQFDGAEGSSTVREATMIYDGHGRMTQRHYPIEDAGVHTSWTYNTDDSVHTVTDPRGVITTFGYYRLPACCSLSIMIFPVLRMERHLHLRLPSNMTIWATKLRFLTESGQLPSGITNCHK
jgi:hypothetical protein